MIYNLLEISVYVFKFGIKGENIMNDNKPPIMILIPFILLGLVLLVVGFYNTYNVNLESKDYVSVDGKYVGRSIYSSDSDGTTYKLTYSYVAGNKEYYISTDYGTSSIPKVGDVRNVKYDPNNPEKAILSGFTGDFLLVFVGGMFIGIPLMVIFTSAVLTSILFILMGLGSYYMMCSSSNSLSLIDAFKMNGLWILIPIMFVGVGLWILIWLVFRKKDKYITVKVEKIEHMGIEGKFRILLSDEKISDSSINAITNKYYIYETSNENKFTENKIYKFNLYIHGVMFTCESVTDIIQARILSSFKDEDFIEEIL